MKCDYSLDNLVAAFRASGLRSGDVVFSHSRIGYFGRASNVSTADGLCRLIYDAFFEVIGGQGTLCVPCYTYSFGSDKKTRIFDVGRSESTAGMFTEYVRGLPSALRSADPMFSIAAIGRAAEALTVDHGPECFGEGSFWQRFLDRRGQICNLNFDCSSTFIHFVERRMNVPYRENRSFRGTIIRNNAAVESEAIYFCRALDDLGAVPHLARFNEIADQLGYARTVRVGRGWINAISALDTARLIETTLSQEPRFLTVAGRDLRQTQFSLLTSNSCME